ncbi:MAG: hypothetical protein FWC79_06035 [Oscillospiraceae bacterium]|nr:hypothetical protein [Oscillospiraceae bacterium]
MKLRMSGKLGRFIFWILKKVEKYFPASEEDLAKHVGVEPSQTTVIYEDGTRWNVPNGMMRAVASVGGGGSLDKDVSDK